MKPEVQKIVNELISLARKNLEQDGELMPVFFVNGKSGMQVIGMPFTNDTEKEIGVMAVKALAKKEKADWIFHITEAWAATMETKEEVEGFTGKVSQHPKRVEIVLFNLQTKEDGNYMAMAEMILFPSGKKTFGEVKLEQGEAKGVFSELLVA